MGLTLPRHSSGISGSFMEVLRDFCTRETFLWSVPGLGRDDTVLIVGRSDTNEGWTLKESHTYEKRPT
jgi:hypothetical protein